MRNPSTSTPGKTGANRAADAARGKDAVMLLEADHRHVEELFRQFEKAKDESQKHQLADKIFLQLRIHTQIEEEIFYPASREFLKDDEVVDKSIAEHQSIKAMIKQIKGMAPSDGSFEAKVSVLKETIEQHVKEEEEELFPQVRKTDMDLKEIGQQLMTRKEELMAEPGGGAASMH
jgi:hemerythrin superfamily protein